jgi:hypothetical protein
VADKGRRVGPAAAVCGGGEGRYFSDLHGNGGLCSVGGVGDDGDGDTGRRWKLDMVGLAEDMSWRMWGVTARSCERLCCLNKRRD